ncbi:hypothetical protein [Chitinophaga sp. MM2321]|uniref:hypothetical protein n=1 Tax=Chitinophaga sp. MM2321 TaxID=3137178 RepID=UPI0032D59DE6
MKRAKIMLTAVAVLATVGGTLAFKARISQYIYTQESEKGNCTVLKTGAKITDTGVILVPATKIPGPCYPTYTTTTFNI